MARRTWVVIALILGWTTITALPGIFLLAVEGCGGLVCLDYSPYGEILVSAWLAGLVAVLGISAATAERTPGHDQAERCPHCGRAVSAGVPTCLNCGYNLVARR